MKRFFHSIGTLIVFLMQMLVYGLIFGTFFYLFSRRHFQLWHLSRTMAVTMLTFVFVGVLLLIVYGGFDIGKRKNKPIILSLSLATILTDFTTWVMLGIMNYNENNNSSFMLEDPDVFILVYAIQVLFIVILTFLGNYIYFKIYDPEKCILITAHRENAAGLFRAIEKFKLQYNILYVDEYQDDRIYRHIDRCDTVFLHEVPITEREKIIEYCYKNFKNYYYTPEITDIVQANGKHLILDDVSLIASPVKELGVEQRLIKRLMDIVVSIVALVLSSPLWLFCAISIKSYDHGPVFFCQNRVTKNGQIFRLLKFRTMKVDVENYSSTAVDDRITPIGHFLRKYRIDELPQFVNILAGDMSVVGPRPEMIENVYNYTNEIPEFEYRLRVKAGLTGYAQVEGKYSTSPKDKLMMDLMYIENYSFLMDIKLLMMTVIVLFKKDSTEGFQATKEINWKKYMKK
ncbi:MAG: exopolysaccharide biosynthesis polyprenyl glycosylphosphotransferase [Lachnospiraceae bacterium]|nr:exopolysaccharide biosynthesis polyprenyl glycosylphosphotransferase [Lachnospiraceae bacterium]